MNAAAVHGTVAHLRTLARTDRRQMFVRVRNATENEARQFLAVALTTEQTAPAPTIPAALVDLARVTGRDGIDALVSSWLHRAEEDGLEVDNDLLTAVDALVDAALIGAAA